MAKLSKDLAALSKKLQCIMLKIHQYRVYFIYKNGPGSYIMDWLFQSNHTENKDEQIKGMHINVNAISTLVNMPVCTYIEDIQVATQEDTH